MSYQCDSCIRGYHIYRAIWNPTVEETLDCTQESSNPRDRYAVSVQKDGQIVGHLPRKISRLCSLFIGSKVWTSWSLFLFLVPWSLFLFLRKSGHNFLVSLHDSRRWHISGKRPRRIRKTRRGCSFRSLRNRAEISSKIRHQGVLATILPKSTERTRTYVIYVLDLLFFCSSASFYDPIAAQRRASPNKELPSTSAILM